MTRWTVLALVGCMVLGGCGDAAPSRPSLPPTPLLRLLTVTPSEHSAPTPKDAGQIIDSVEFAGEHRWLRLRTPRDEPDVGLAFEAIRPGQGSLRLGRDGSWGAARILSVRPGDALSVRVRGAGLEPNLHPRRDGGIAAEDGAVDVALVIELKAPLDPSRPLDVAAAQALTDRRRHTQHLLEADAGAFDVTARFVTDRLTHALLVVLLAPNAENVGARLYESVELRRHGVSDHAAAGGTLPDVHALADAAAPGAVAVRLDRELRQALLAPAPSSFTWDIPGAAEARRLSLSLGVLPREASLPGSVRFVVRAVASGGSAATDGVLLDEVVSASDDPARPAWHDRHLALPDDGGRGLRLTLSTEAVGDDPPLAFLGHPAVHTGVGERRPNVVLISLDTLRPDRLGCYGGDASLSPHIDAMAATGVRFERAFSTSSYTLPSHASMFTGQFPAFHGAVNIDDALDPEHSPMLTRILADAGYTTAAFTGGGYVDPYYGFDHGFDRYSVNDPVWAYDSLRGRMLLDTMSFERDPLRMELLERYGAGLVADWIDDQVGGAPFFLFLHTYITHNYAPDHEWLGKRGLLGEEPVPERPFDHKDRTRFNDGQTDLRDAVYEQYMPYYDATIGMADAFVGRIVAALDDAGLADDTLVVLTSDHGEEFGEHDFFGHGETLWDEATRIPLIVRLPAAASLSQPRVEDGLVSLVDLAPWILSLVGLPADRRMATVAPLGPVRAEPPARSFVVMELDNLHDRRSSWRQDGLQLHVQLGENGEDLPEERVELYDVVEDPGQRRDVAAERTDDAQRLRELLRKYHVLASAVRPRQDGPTDLASLPEEMRQQLAALGYLADTAPDEDENDGED